MTDAPVLPRRVPGDPSTRHTRRRSPDPAVAAGTPAPRRPLARRLLSFVLTAVVVAGAVYLWPARFGGSTRMVVVSGHSMEPTYDLGDIVIARGGRDAAVGDIVVFAVPDGNARGMLVIHRIVGIDAQGRFVTQGDNRDTPDQWPLTQDDIVGMPLVRVPKGGLVVRFLQQWFVLAAILGLLAILLLWPRRAGDENDGDDEDHEHAELVPSLTDAVTHTEATTGIRHWSVPDELPRLDLPPNWRVGQWTEAEIPAAVMADAEEWLERELERELTTAGR